MVVVDEVHVPVVDPLVIGHVRVGRVDAHRLAQHLRQRPARLHQPVVDFARALLVARENPLLESGVKGIGTRNGHESGDMGFLRQTAIRRPDGQAFQAGNFDRDPRNP